MATTTPNFGWSVPTSTDLVKDGATAIETLGDAIDASLVDLKGGTTGQILAKNSATDMDFVWSAAGMTNPMTTTGDTIYSSSGSTPARRAIGTTGQVLTVSGGVPVWSTLATDKTIAQITSGTMPAASSLSLTGLSSYDTIIVRLDGLTWATTNASIMVTINSDTAANYELVGGYNQTTYSAYLGSTSTNYFYAGFGAASQDRTNANNYRFYVFTNCKAAGFTNAVIQEGFVSSGGDTPNANSIGIYKSAATVSSIQFKTSTGNNYSAGNYVIWGG